jgi:hypothetical protein
VPLGAGADQVAVAGEEQEGPVGAALALEQPLEDCERLVGTPLGEGGAVVTADHQVGALALPDLVADHGLDQLGVVVVVGLEAAAVGEGHPGVVDRLDHLGDGELPLALDVDDDQRRTVVVRLEAALAHLAERDRQQPVRDVTVVRCARLQRYVEQRLDGASPAPHQPDGVPVPRPRRPPDDRPRLVLPQRLDGFASTADLGVGHARTLLPPPRPGGACPGSWRGSPV